MKSRDSNKCKEWERHRRDRLAVAFNGLVELLPNYDPAHIPPKIEILENSTQFIKELRLSNSRLLSTQTHPKELTSKIQFLQDEVNKLILRLKQLTNLLVAAKIPIPRGPSIQCLGKRKLKWSGKIKQVKTQKVEDEPHKELFTSAIKQGAPESNKLINMISQKTTLTITENRKPSIRKEIPQCDNSRSPSTNENSDPQDKASFNPPVPSLSESVPTYPTPTFVLTPITTQPIIQLTFASPTPGGNFRLPTPILSKVCIPSSSDTQKIPIRPIRKPLPPKRARKERAKRPKVAKVLKKNLSIIEKADSETQTVERRAENESEMIACVEITQNENTTPPSDLPQIPVPDDSVLNDLESKSTVPDAPEEVACVEPFIVDPEVDTIEHTKTDDMPEPRMAESNLPELGLTTVAEEPIGSNTSVVPFTTTEEFAPENPNTDITPVSKEGFIDAGVGSDENASNSHARMVETVDYSASLASTNNNHLKNTTVTELLLDNNPATAAIIVHTTAEKQQLLPPPQLVSTVLKVPSPLSPNTLSSEKISECIARSIGLIEPSEESELMELGATDWGDVVGVGDDGHSHSPKSISPTQMFLSMFPLLPREGVIAPEGAATPSSQHQPSSTHQHLTKNRSSFYIDSMLPEESSHCSTNGNHVQPVNFETLVTLRTAQPVIPIEPPLSTPQPIRLRGEKDGNYSRGKDILSLSTFLQPTAACSNSHNRRERDESSRQPIVPHELRIPPSPQLTSGPKILEIGSISHQSALPEFLPNQQNQSRTNRKDYYGAYVNGEQIQPTKVSNSSNSSIQPHEVNKGSVTAHQKKQSGKKPLSSSSRSSTGTTSTSKTVHDQHNHTHTRHTQQTQYLLPPYSTPNVTVNQHQEEQRHQVAHHQQLRDGLLAENGYGQNLATIARQDPINPPPYGFEPSKVQQYSSVEPIVPRDFHNQNTSANLAGPIQTADYSAYFSSDHTHTSVGPPFYHPTVKTTAFYAPAPVAVGSQSQRSNPQIPLPTQSRQPFYLDNYHHHHQHHQHSTSGFTPAAPTSHSTETYAITRSQQGTSYPQHSHHQNQQAKQNQRNPNYSVQPQPSPQYTSQATCPSSQQHPQQFSRIEQVSNGTTVVAQARQQHQQQLPSSSVSSQKQTSHQTYNSTAQRPRPVNWMTESYNNKKSSTSTRTAPNNSSFSVSKLMGVGPSENPYYAETLIRPPPPVQSIQNSSWNLETFHPDATSTSGRQNQDSQQEFTNHQLRRQTSSGIHYSDGGVEINSDKHQNNNYQFPIGNFERPFYNHHHPHQQNHPLPREAAATIHNHHPHYQHQQQHQVTTFPGGSGTSATSVSNFNLSSIFPEIVDKNSNCNYYVHSANTRNGGGAGSSSNTSSTRK